MNTGKAYFVYVFSSIKRTVFFCFYLRHMAATKQEDELHASAGKKHLNLKEISGRQNTQACELG